MTAHRVDEALRIRESAAFFGSNERMLGVTHAPLEDARAGAVVCGPIFVDQIKTYRAEVGLARGLATQGIVTQRFQYRGFGHSDGDPLAVTYDSMVSDARTAIEQLQELSDSLPLAIVGIRWGALVAATIARELPGVPLVLWDPVMSSRGFFKEAFRAHVMKTMSSGGSASTKELLTQIDTQGFADVLGFGVGRGLYESSADKTLVDELGTGGRRVQVLYLASHGAMPPALADAEDQWSRGEIDSTLHEMMATDEAWWFLADSSKPFRAEEFVTRSLAWLAEALPTRVTR